MERRIGRLDDDRQTVRSIRKEPSPAEPLRAPSDAQRPLRRTRVLVLIKCLGYGGAERLVVHMLRHRGQDRFDYEVAYVLAGENTLVPDLEAAGVRVHSLGARSNKDLAWTFRLRSLLKRGDFDIVHTHLPYAATLGRIVLTTLPRRSRPAIIYTEHNMWDRMAVALKALNRVTIGFDDRVLVVSEAARQSMPPAIRRRAQVVIHGIELDEVRATLTERAQLRTSVREELGLREGELLALTVANLRREKAYDVLLRAARVVADLDLPIRFVAAGRGPFRDELIALHAELGLDETFQFLGQRRDVIRLLAGADMFVLPSRQEGLPVVIMEAACAGVPLLVTTVGELPTLLTNGVDAILVPPEDPEDLADAVVRLAGDEDMRERLGAAWLKRSDLFDVARCVCEVEHVYEDLSSRYPQRTAS